MTFSFYRVILIIKCAHGSGSGAHFGGGKRQGLRRGRAMGALRLIAVLAHGTLVVGQQMGGQPMGGDDSMAGGQPMGGDDSMAGGQPMQASSCFAMS
eukprot:COSAG04_NODE_13022_length_623_cov_1.259542_1_plen_96_part_01